MRRLVLCWLVACGGSKAPPPAAPVSNTSTVQAPPPLSHREACDALFTHLIELELGKAGAAKAGKADAKLREMFANKRAEFVKTCEDKTPRERVDCALKAKTFDEITACDPHVEE